MLRFLRFGLRRPYLALIVPTLVVTGLFGWQAVESQEVKNALTGGFEVEPWFVTGDGGRAAVVTQFENRGDTTLTLESAGLIEPRGVDLIGIRARTAEEPGFRELEGVEVPPGAFVRIEVSFRPTRAGRVGFGGIRLHYEAGGRAGQAVSDPPA